MKKAFVFLAAVMLLGSNVFASTNNNEYSEDSRYDAAVPYYIGIDTASNSLSITVYGSAECYSVTKTLSGYQAKVKVELQQKNSTWKTIKTWIDTDDVSAVISKNYSVSKGYSYRLKTTHYALDSKGKVVESFTMYSNTKSY